LRSKLKEELKGFKERKIIEKMLASDIKKKGLMTAGNKMTSCQFGASADSQDCSIGCSSAHKKAIDHEQNKHVFIDDTTNEDKDLEGGKIISFLPFDNNTSASRHGLQLKLGNKIVSSEIGSYKTHKGAQLDFDVYDMNGLDNIFEKHERKDKHKYELVKVVDTINNLGSYYDRQSENDSQNRSPRSNIIPDDFVAADNFVAGTAFSLAKSFRANLSNNP
jgi:hypothetical protein